MALVNNQEINIWDLGDKINIKVNKDFMGLINDKIKEKYKTKRNVHKELMKYYCLPFSTFKTRTKIGYKYFVDLEILLNLCKLLDISLDDLQSNILAYKTRGGYNYIEDPKLPILITPVFDMLVAHHMGDGSVVNPKKGRKPYFSYRQYDEIYKNLYIEKIESVFGNLKYRKDYFNNASQIYFPVAVSELMFRLYNLNVDSFKSEIARIPKEILNKNHKHKLAFLIALIIDEGHVDSDLILIRMKNKHIIEDLSKICSDLNYSASLKEGKEGMFCLYITSKNLNKFYQDYLNLLKEYPEVNLGHKEQKIKEFINRMNNPRRYIEGNKLKVVNELSISQLTVNELAKRLNMTRQGARYLINELIKESKVEIKAIVKFRNYKYGMR